MWEEEKEKELIDFYTVYYTPVVLNLGAHKIFCWGP